MSRARPQKARKTRPTLRVQKRATGHPAPADDVRKRSEAPTMPPPAPGEDAPRHSGRVKKGPAAATVDVVTADLSKDKRREE